MTPEVTVLLAAEDALPVVFSAVGCLLLSRVVVPRMRLVAVGGALCVGAGGTAKVGWKLTLALGGADLHALEVSMFGWLAVGFTLLAWALLVSVRPLSTARSPVVILAAAGAAAAWTRSTGPLLATTVATATAVGLIAIVLARRAGDAAATAGFVAQLAVAYALVPFALPPQTLAKQWTEQGLNTFGQALFALAAARLAFAGRGLMRSEAVA